MHIRLYAMTAKGLAVVEHVIRHHRQLLAGVVGARDVSVVDDHADAIRACCVAAGVPYVRRGEGPEPDADYALAVSWRWLLDLPPRRLVVLHDSLLPRYRGFNPLVTALINGDFRIGVSALFATDDCDAGDLIAQESVAVVHPITIATAIAAITPCYVRLAEQILSTLATGQPLSATPQDETQASYSLWRDDDDYRIDWTQSAEQIARFVAAVGHPYLGAVTTVAGRRLRVLGGEALIWNPLIANRTPGKVLQLDEGRPVVVCGSGLYRIDELADEGTGESCLPWPRLRTRFGA